MCEIQKIGLGIILCVHLKVDQLTKFLEFRSMIYMQIKINMIF